MDTLTQILMIEEELKKLQAQLKLAEEDSQFYTGKTGGLAQKAGFKAELERAKIVAQIGKLGSMRESLRAELGAWIKANTVKPY